MFRFIAPYQPLTAAIQSTQTIPEFPNCYAIKSAGKPLVPSLIANRMSNSDLMQHESRTAKHSTADRYDVNRRSGCNARSARLLWKIIFYSISSAAVGFAADDRDEVGPSERFERHIYRISSSDGRTSASLGYRLLTPDSLESRREYPLVLFLHGAGARGTDNDAQLRTFPDLMVQPEYRRQYPCFLVAPQCPPGRRWEDEFDAVIGILHDVMQRHPIDRRRIYLTGYSMGGYGAWSLAARHPDLFAAVAPAEGGGDVRTAQLLVDVPIWAIHGDADQVVAVSKTREMVQAIQWAGGSPKYTELSGVGHNSWPRAFTGSDGVIAWMFAQRKPWLAFGIDWPVTLLLIVDVAVIVSLVASARRNGRRRRFKKHTADSAS